MNIEDIRSYCLEKPGVTEGFPFDEVTLVFKVAEKMFALVPLEKELQINLKCDPEKALGLREKYESVVPGYHMSKKHWNTVFINGSIPNRLIYQWIDDSYQLIVSKLPKRLRDTL